jgi:hypothetical protein
MQRNRNDEHLRGRLGRKLQDCIGEQFAQPTCSRT